MATSYKVLGQSAPSATTNTDVYTCPSATQAIVSSIVVANRSASVQYFRIAVRKSGATLSNSHYVCYDSFINGNDSSIITIGITMSASDIITVYASSADLSVSIFGSEIS